jgi:hypothetical protein
MREAQESHKIILSFLGTGNYQPCRYTYRGKVCKTAYFAYALNSFYPEYRAKIVMTAAAKNSHHKKDKLQTPQKEPEASFSYDS